MPGRWKWFWAFVQTGTFTAQSAHFFAGLGVTALAAHFMPARLAAFLFLLLWAIPKKLVWDAILVGEGHGSPDWDDLFFYCFGAATSTIVLDVARYLSL